MAIITLTTDFGEKDHFAGAIKGAIYSELEEIKIVDISHSVSPFNISEAAYIIQNAYSSFPKGTIHLIGIDSELSPENKHIAVKLDDHYFICANNGIMSMICAEIAPEKTVEINIHDRVESNFPVLDIFVKVACHIARGGTLEIVGKPFSELNDLREFAPRIVEDGKKIIGSVIYIDNYGNVITNIRKNLFDAYRNGRNYEVSARGKVIKKIHTKYSDIIDYNTEINYRKGPGDLLALFNSSEYLELAIYKSNLTTVGGASTLLGLDYRDTITINFL